MSEGRLYYLSDIADEVMPCAPTLDAWAAWLSQPDESWPHDIPEDGATFRCTTLDHLGDVTATVGTHGVVFNPGLPGGATSFVQRYGVGAGWDPDTWSDDVITCIGDAEEDEELLIACVANGPELVLVYRADPPRLEIPGGQA